MVKTIADFHNIDVKVESKLGEGSTFTVVFKLYAKQE
jgi:signal transduction histidine kinase